MTKDEQFFFEHAGYSFAPATETQEQGRERCAKEYANAEAYARERGWSTDFVESDEWTGEKLTGYDACLWDADGNMIGHLGGVTFKDNNPHEPYRRVVAAELALEAMHQEAERTQV